MCAVRRVLASDAPLSYLNADNVHYVKLAFERPFPLPCLKVLSCLS